MPQQRIAPVGRRRVELRQVLPPRQLAWQGGVNVRCLAVMRISSASDLVCILSIIRARCSSTVLMLISSSSAMVLFSFPATTRSSICRSRSVSEAIRSATGSAAAS